VAPESRREIVAELAEIGITAFTTTRAAGSFALNAPEPSAEVWERWLELATSLRSEADRLAFAHQVHGSHVLEHLGGWTGILRVPDADGHFSFDRPTAMAVTLADCVPVFVAHPAGAAAVVHSGWKGTVAGIVRVAIRIFEAHGLPAADLRVHCGPSICGRCYEVGPDVYAALTGTTVSGPAPVDLRALILGQAADSGARHLSASTSCTRCHNDRFFSHRSGDHARQLGVIVSRRKGE
jgi:YfiH family protein